MCTENKMKDALANLKFARGTRLQKEAKLREVEVQAAKMRSQADAMVTDAKKELARANEKLATEADVWNRLSEEIGSLNFD